MMAYKKNFAVAIKHNGRILRELEEVVSLPFGTEYSILLKNKDSRRAVVDVEIDGDDVLDRSSLIIEPNTSFELKGFMKGMAVRNKFRFIEKTEQISKHRGDKIDDGLVRVEFKFERQVYVMPKVISDPTPFGGNIWGNINVGSTGGPNTLKSSTTDGPLFASCCYNTSVVSDEGITVKGSETHQGFSVGSTKELEPFSSVITLKLRGINKRTKKVVKKAIGVKTRLVCSTCGKKSKSVAKFCNRCSAYLH